MRYKKIIKKLLILTAWMLVIAGMCTLLVAANRSQRARVCKKVVISIKGSPDNFYIEKADVLKLAEMVLKGSLLQRSVTAIDLKMLEAGLETNPWIYSARLFFDNKEILHITVQERDPVARVFTRWGHSFYIDSAGRSLPVLQKIVARVPMITGFPAAGNWTSGDSALLKTAKDISTCIYASEFWNAQIGEISIMPDKKFELVPVIGDHRIKLGDGCGIEDKLSRLFVFYKQVMSKTGFNKYSELNLSFDGQVVAVRRGEGVLVDSALLKKNIEALMQQRDTAAADQAAEPHEVAIGYHDSSGEHEAVEEDSTQKKETAPVVKAKERPKPVVKERKPVVKKQEPKKPAVKTETMKKATVKKEPVKTIQKPKAVLKKAPANEY